MKFRDVFGNTHELNVAPILKTAIVGSADEYGVYLQFVGDNAPRLKPYKRCDSYTPAEGDKVLVAHIGSDEAGTDVIIGKVV